MGDLVLGVVLILMGIAVIAIAGPLARHEDRVYGQSRLFGRWPLLLPQKFRQRACQGFGVLIAAFGVAIAAAA